MHIHIHTYIYIYITWDVSGGLGDSWHSLPPSSGATGMSGGPAPRHPDGGATDNTTIDTNIHMTTNKHITTHTTKHKKENEQTNNNKQQRRVRWAGLCIFIISMFNSKFGLEFDNKCFKLYSLV